MEKEKWVDEFKQLQNKELEDMTEIELKAIGYNTMKQIELFQRQLDQLQPFITKFEKKRAESFNK